MLEEVCRLADGVSGGVDAERGDGGEGDGCWRGLSAGRQGVRRDLGLMLGFCDWVWVQCLGHSFLQLGSFVFAAWVIRFCGLFPPFWRLFRLVLD